jgi:TonB family protein
MARPVSCVEFEDLAVLHALGELDDDARAGVEEHARACEPCAAVLQRETDLAAILSPASRSAADQESTDVLLAHCRSRLGRTLDDAPPTPSRTWTSIFSLRDWIASLRLSPRLHPAWSVAALTIIAAVSGFAGWVGLGRTPLQILGPAIITVSAAPPPLAAPAPEATPAPAPSSVENVPAPQNAAADSRVYSATEAGMNDAFSGGLFHAPQNDSDRPLSSWRHAPPLRMPANSSLDAAPTGGLDEISRTMENLWWGGIRVSPAEQQKRLVLAPLPEYPEVARRAGIEGQVTMLVRIDRDGTVDTVEQLSGEPVLGRAAAEAVEQWRYSPLRIGGEPVNVLTSVTLAFQLHP